jgi:hypothetical protein
VTDPFAFGASPDEALAAVRAQIDAAAARDAAIGRLAETVAGAAATVRSARGEVEVSATAGAAVTAVRFSDDALELSVEELGRLTTETIVKAQRQAAEFALTAAEAELGAGSPFVSGLRAEVEARYAPQEPDAGPRW